MQHGWHAGRLSGWAGRGYVQLPVWLRRAGDRLTGLLLAERERWLLWLPVCAGLGIAAFFSLPGEPPRYLTLLVLLLAAMAGAGAWLAGRRRAALTRAACVALAAAGAGFCLAHARLEAVRAPVLQRESSFEVTGRIAALEPRGHGVRLLLDQVALSRLAPEQTPPYVRVTLNRSSDGLMPGQVVRLKARLQPPGSPAVPGGFDYARQAYFDQLGGLGYGFTAPDIVSSPASVDTAVADLRARIGRRITDIVPGQTGAFVAALLAGLQAGIDQKTWRDFQISGLAHLISISGLHMALVAGTVFGLARYGLALLPWLALRVRVHKPAAVLALAAVAFYYVLAGPSVPTQRSFLTIGIALTAVLVDRNPLSLRLFAWAALLIEALRPEALVGASFQLSFSAVLALLAAYELPRVRELGSGLGTGIVGIASRYVLGVATTTVIASGATSPLSAYHFQNVATYGVLANLIAVPLTSFIIMPAGLIGLALMPFGLDAWAFRLVGIGSAAVLETAHRVAELPGASIPVAQWPVEALVLFCLGGLWLALWRQRWRLLGLIPCTAALIVALLHPVPDLLVAPDLDAIGLRLPDGRLAVREWASDARLRDNWQRAEGASELVRLPPAGGLGLSCDAEACIVELGRWQVSLARTTAAVVEDCALADLVVGRTGPERCTGNARLVGPRALRNSGGLAITAGTHGLVIEQVEDGRGRWPWSRAGYYPLAGSFNSE